MINIADITDGLKTVLEDNLNGYLIQRSERRNSDPNICATYKGWVGIYRGSISYTPYTIGGSQPWLVNVELTIIVQTVSSISGEDAEDKLTAAEKEIMDVLNSNKKLNNTVLQSMGYAIEYEQNMDTSNYFIASVITLTAELRAGA